MDQHTHTHRGTHKLMCTVRLPEGHLEVQSKAQLVSSEHSWALDPSSARSHSEAPITDSDSVLCVCMCVYVCTSVIVGVEVQPSSCPWKTNSPNIPGHVCGIGVA